MSDDGVVTVELQGACKGCPMSQMTLANGVERILKERIPGVLRLCRHSSSSKRTQLKRRPVAALFHLVKGLSYGILLGNTRLRRRDDVALPAQYTR